MPDPDNRDWTREPWPEFNALKGGPGSPASLGWSPRQSYLGTAAFLFAADYARAAACVNACAGIPTAALGQIPAMAAAAAYYRAAFERTRPEWVPERVRLAEEVTGDFPFHVLSRAPAGDHDAKCNQWGAVSVRATNGEWLGVRPREFEVLSWKRNPHAVAAAESALAENKRSDP